MTRERLTRYLKAAGQDVPRALELYEYNVHLSEAVYGILHGLEVAVRNAEHHALTAGYKTQAWYGHIVISPYWQEQIEKARAKPGVSNKPGKIVAELSFGFWIELLQQSNHMDLWVKGKLHSAFPNQKQRKLIHKRLKTIQLLRNRISHHEPILTSSKRLYTGAEPIVLMEVIECINWVCSDTAKWIQTRFHYQEAENILKEVSLMEIPL